MNITSSVNTICRANTGGFTCDIWQTYPSNLNCGGCSDRLSCSIFALKVHVLQKPDPCLLVITGASNVSVLQVPGETVAVVISKYGIPCWQSKTTYSCLAIQPVQTAVTIGYCL